MLLGRCLNQNTVDSGGGVSSLLPVQSVSAPVIAVFCSFPLLSVEGGRGINDVTPVTGCCIILKQAGCDREFPMLLRKPLIVLLTIAALAIAIPAVIYVQRERHDPCTHLTRTELAERYPRLAELLAQQSAESSQLLARQRAQDFEMNVEMNDKQISLEDALNASTQQIDEVAGMRERHRKAFDAMCRQVVDEE